MFTAICEDDAGRSYTGALYHAGCLAALPWGDEAFDCVVFLRGSTQTPAARTELSRELARANVDWVQVAGDGAEELHDAIDRASVFVGRQQFVGNGSPMTSWHEEAQSAEDMAEVAALCFGGQNHVLVLVVGEERDLSDSVAAVKRCVERDADSFS